MRTTSGGEGKRGRARSSAKRSAKTVPRGVEYEFFVNQDGAERAEDPLENDIQREKTKLKREFNKREYNKSGNFFLSD